MFLFFISSIRVYVCVFHIKYKGWCLCFFKHFPSVKLHIHGIEKCWITFHHLTRYLTWASSRYRVRGLYVVVISIDLNVTGLLFKYWPLTDSPLKVMRSLFVWTWNDLLVVGSDIFKVPDNWSNQTIVST